VTYAAIASDSKVTYCRFGRKRRLVLLLFFFSSRRRHTSFSRDWSSDVCSSDLRDAIRASGGKAMIVHADVGDEALVEAAFAAVKIGRASCRERVETSVGAVVVTRRSNRHPRQSEHEDARRERRTT